MNDSTDIDTERRVVLGMLSDEDKAQQVMDALVERDFPLDRVSVLGQAGASGDDPLGVYYPSVGERMKGWGKMGAFWGGLFGLLGGAMGMFVLPGVGAVVAVGPVTQTLVGAAAGAGVGGGLMAGGAALAGLTQAVHRMGIPEERLEDIERNLQRGHYLVLLIVDADEAPANRRVLEGAGAETVWTYPYAGLTDALAQKTGD
jgi:hypothetical protein